MARYSIQVRGNEVGSTDVLADAFAIAAKTPARGARPPGIPPFMSRPVVTSAIKVIDTTTNQEVKPPPGPSPIPAPAPAPAKVAASFKRGQ